MRLLSYVFLLLLVFQTSKKKVVYILPELSRKSEIGIGEDLEGRIEYRQSMLSDPKTGLIPKAIELKELEFQKARFLEGQSARTSTLDIVLSGPFNVGGRTRAVAFDVRNESVIIAGGVSGGIWKTTDGGISWTRKSNPENRNSISCLVQDTRPGKQDTWYHGTGEIVGGTARSGPAPFRGSGIFKSTDNGETWNPIVSTQSDPNTFNSQFQYIWNIVLNEDNSEQDELIVAAFGGILRSIDGGDSWDAVLGQKLFDLPDSTDLNTANASDFVSVEKSANDIYFATFSSTSLSGIRSPHAGIFLSEDGRRWFDISPFERESTYRRIVMGMNESRPNRPYFLVDSSPISILQFNYEGINVNFSGDSVVIGRYFNKSEHVPNFGGQIGDFDTQGSYNMIIKVHPENEDIVFVGGTNLYRTTDGFTSDENNRWIGGYDKKNDVSVYPGHHPDQHELLFYPSNSSKVLSANDGGLRISDDATAEEVRWRSINNGYLTSQFYTIAQSKVEGTSIILGGMQDNGTYIAGARRLSNWTKILGGDGSYVATSRNDIFWFASSQRGRTFRLELGDNLSIISLARIDPENLVATNGSAFLFINPFVVDPGEPNRVFMAGGTGIYFNSNISQIPSGSTESTSLGWTLLREPTQNSGRYTALEISYDAKVLFAGNNSGQLRKVMNADSIPTSDVFDITSPIFPEGAYVSSISVNPDDNNHVLVTFSNYNVQSIFESTDGGASFEAVGGNLEENEDGSGNGPSIRWGELIPTNAGTLYLVGTSVGLFSTAASEGANTLWTKESTDLVGSAVITMMDYRPVDGSLVIASHGNGAYATTIPDFKPIEISRRRTSEQFTVANPYPNPFNVSSTIQFDIPEDGIVKVDIIDTQGNLVRNLLWANQFAGLNSVSFDGNSQGGFSLSNGLYFIRFSYNGQVRSKRVLLRR